jgi:hypothetical protein
MADDPSNIMTIDSGLHAGVRRPFMDGRYSIGASRDCDIALMDEGLCARHLTVEIIEGDAQVVARDGAVTVNGQVLQPGEHDVFALPLEVSISEAGLKLGWHLREQAAPGEAVQAAVAPAPVIARQGGMPRLRWPARLGRPAYAALVALFSLVFITSMLKPAGRAMGDGARADNPAPAMVMASLGRPDVANPVNALQPPASTIPVRSPLSLRQPSASVVDRPVVTRVTPADIERAAADLRKELASSFAHLQIEATEDGVKAEGPLAPEDLPRWRGVVQRFDTRHNGRILLTRSGDVRPLREEPVPKIEAVWLGERPYVVVAKRRYYVSQSIEGTWLVEKVSRGEVVLNRSGQTIRVTLPGLG